MLVAVQFPLADCRQFVESSGQLPQPSWPLPLAGSEFVRSFGGIKIRKLRGIEGWVGEDKLCEASKAFRFGQTLCLLDRDANVRFPLRCQYRRFYSDGQAVSKFEVGIVPARKGFCELESEETTTVLTHCLTQIVDVRGSAGKTRRCQLIEAGDELAALYRRASTATAHEAGVQEWWVQAGTPIVFLQTSGHEQVAALPYWRKPIRVSSDLQFDLSGYLMEYPAGRVPMWMMGPVWFAEADKARLLRLYEVDPFVKTKFELF